MLSIVNKDHSFCTYKQFFEKQHTYVCASGLRNVSFPENLGYILNEWSYTFFPAGIYLFKVNNRNTKAICEICSKLTIKTKRTTSMTLIFCLYLLLTMNRFNRLFWCFSVLTLNKWMPVGMFLEVALRPFLPVWNRSSPSTIPRRNLLVQSQLWKHQSNVWNLFKVKNKYTSSVYIVNFEQNPNIVLVLPLLTLNQ